LKFIDLFAGIGGFRLGMKMAGHECVGHVEIDKFANYSYTAMHLLEDEELLELQQIKKYRKAQRWIESKMKNRGEYYANDIRRIEPRELPEADIWCGGFPCQTFSIAGARRGFEDMRGTLIFEVFRLATERKPKIIFLENVAGLLNHDRGRTFATILHGFWELGYDVEWQLLNSKDFGVPHNRERVFIVGYSRGTSRRKLFPITRASEQTLMQIIGGSQGKRVYDINGLSCTLAGEAGGQGAKTGLYLIGKDGKKKNKDYYSCLTGGGNSGGNHSDMDLIVQAVLTPDRLEKRQNGRRFKEDEEPMFTLTAQDRHGVMISEATKKGYDIAIEGDSINLAVPGSKTRRGRVEKGVANTLDANCNQGVLNGTKIRRLTPRECFRLQGFPDEYFDRARKVNSDSQLYKQAGNSVTVNVIYEIAKRL